MIFILQPGKRQDFLPGILSEYGHFLFLLRMRKALFAILILKFQNIAVAVS
jgi:hypothetical protein